MNISNILYFDFYSVGSIILVAFTITLAIFLHSIKNKSKATFHLGMGFTYLVIFHAAYFFSSSFYDPVTAYHRWFTVLSVLLAEAHMDVLIINFPEERNPLISKIFLITLYAIVIASSALFFKTTYYSNKLFHFFGHYYDFDADQASKLIGLLIIVYIALFAILMIWKVIISHKKIRWWILFFGLSYIIAAGAPSVVNNLSRDGLLERDIYEITKDLSHIFGFFIMFIIYINTSREKTTFMTKIVGISIATFLVVLQALSFITTRDQESAYNKIHISETNYAIDTSYRPADLKYIMSYSIDKDMFTPIDIKEPISINFNVKKNDILNTALYEKIKRIPDNNFKDTLKKLLDKSPEHFIGYKNVLIDMSKRFPSNEKNKGIKVTKHIDTLERRIIFQKNRIKQLDDNDFKNSLQKFLQKGHITLIHFNKALSDYLNKTDLDGKELKNKIIQFHVPMNEAGTRNYRENMDKSTHYTAFIKVDLNSNKIYEAGYSYLAYREFIHPSSKKLIITMLCVYIFIFAGFPLFFLGNLVRPLRGLLDGVTKVMDGNLNFDVAVRVEDEVGYLTHSFNEMVRNIKKAKEEIQDYANNLEAKVAERTEELKASNEELESMNNALVEARDALWGEMELARKIQTILLPKHPKIPGYEISAYMEPADEVGGDYYDIINVKDRDWVVIGDVSGHGVPAGLVMMMVQTAIQVTLDQNPDLSPSEVLTIINRTIAKNIRHLGEDKYMTITVLASHTNGQFIFSGLHQDIMIYRTQSKSIEIVETNGMWIGIMDNINGMVDNEMLQMYTGDTILLYTDGLTEAVDNKGVMLSTRRLKEIFNSLGSQAPCAIKNGILKELYQYTTKDDVTLVILKKIE